MMGHVRVRGRSSVVQSFTSGRRYSLDLYTRDDVSSIISQCRISPKSIIAVIRVTEI